MASNSTRRSFLGRAAATMGAVAPVMGKPARRVIGANDRIQIAQIGVGNNGSGMLRRIVQRAEQKSDVRAVAACDVYSRYRDRAISLAHLDAKSTYIEYRDLLARNDVDAVIISTPDHWHSPMAIDAMAAGKDVYLQKPMTYTIDEARKVAEAAHKYQRVLQVGSQHLADPRCHKARELIEGGEIGDLLWAQSTFSRNSKTGEWNYYIDEEASEETIDWKRWIGPAPKRSFSTERFFRWRKYWDYSGGIATDLFYHRLGPVLYSMGPRFPTRVTGSGGIYVQKDREVPDSYSTTIEYPNFYIVLSASMANAAAVRYVPVAIYGHKGSIVFGNDQLLLAREAIFDPNATNKQGAVQEIPVPKVNISEDHLEDWLSGIRTRKQPRLNADFGYQIMTAIQLGVNSYRHGKVMCFDPATEKMVKKPASRPGYEGTGKNLPDSRYKKRA